MNIKKKVFILLSTNLLTLLILGVTQVAAQDSKDKLPPSIRTSGEAVVTAKPDRAQIDIGVVTQADTSQAAVAQNAQKLEATLARLRQLLKNTADIKTISYNVSPNYRYPKEGGEPTITGYTAQNIVRVTLDDLTRIGNVIDTATQSGANRVQNLQFRLKDEATVQAQALRLAAIQARTKAQALASALGLQIRRVLSVVESGSPISPVLDVAYARVGEASQTPIEPGTIEVRASVSFTVEVFQ